MFQNISINDDVWTIAVVIRPKEKWSHRSNRGRDTFNPRPLPESIAWDWGSLIFCLRWAALPEKMKWDERDQWQYQLDNHSQITAICSQSPPLIYTHYRQSLPSPIPKSRQSVALSLWPLLIHLASPHYWTGRCKTRWTFCHSWNHVAFLCPVLILCITMHCCLMPPPP